MPWFGESAPTRWRRTETQPQQLTSLLPKASCKSFGGDEHQRQRRDRNCELQNSAHGFPQRCEAPTEVSSEIACLPS